MHGTGQCCAPLADEGGPVDDELIDGRDDVLHQVGGVADQVAQHAAAGVLVLEAPRQRGIGIGGVVGEEAHGGVLDLPIRPEATIARARSTAGTLR